MHLLPANMHTIIEHSQNIVTNAYAIDIFDTI